MTALDETGHAAQRTTEIHGYPLPPFPEGRWEPSFDGWKRYKIKHPITGRQTAFTRATTIAHTLDDTYNLEKWKRRMMLLGLDRHVDLTETVEAIHEAASTDNSNALERIAEDLQVYAGSADGREFGSATHDWIEALDAGRILLTDIPEQYREHARQYLAALARNALTPVPEYSERIIYNSKAEAVGRIDRIYALCDDTLAMGDLKTSKAESLGFGVLNFAVQFAIYEGADFMLSYDGQTWEPMPEIRHDYVVCLHVPSDHPEQTAAITFDGPAGRAALAEALTVRKMRSSAKKVIPNHHAMPIPSAHDAALHAAILAVRTSTTPEQVSAAWEEHQAVWNDDLTALGNAVVEALQEKETATP